MRPGWYCSYNGCKNNNKVKGIQFHRFPKDESRCNEWLKAAKNEKLSGKSVSILNKNHVLCSKHFQTWCFMNPNSKSRLVHNAVPNAPKPNKKQLPDSQEITNPTHELQDSISPFASPLTTNNAVPNAPKPNEKELPDSQEITNPTHENQDSISPFASPLTTNLDSVQNSTCYTEHKRHKRKYTQNEKLLAKKLKQLRDRVRRKVCYKCKKSNRNKFSLQETLSSEGVSENLAGFIQRQVKLNLTKSKRYTEEDKIQAYQLFCKSPAAYNALKKVLELPTSRTLQRFISTKLSNPGISTDVILALKRVLETDKGKADKKFALIFDEMSIKPGLSYDSCKNPIGFEDLGEGNKTDCVANQVLVLMLRSLTSKKKLPIGFFFSQHAITSEKLLEIVLKALEQLKHAGAEVKALICDQRANNQKLYTLLGVDEKVPFFMYEGEKIFCIFDPPHLLKNLRLNLMEYNLKTSKGTVSFQYIEDFYNFEQTALVKCAPKLTEAHIKANGLNPMKVSLAAQVFSHSVAAGMYMAIMSGFISSNAIQTVEFIDLIDKLFDSMNGTRKHPLHGKNLHCAVKEDSGHFSFWNEMLEFIASWEFLQPNTDIPIKGHGPQNKSGWLLTITSIIMLSKEILQKKDFFLTKRCNQDCLEDFFSRIRGSGGNRNNPSASEFCSSYWLASVNASEAML